MTPGRNRQRQRARYPGGSGAVASVLSLVQSDGWQGVWASGTPPTFDPNGAPVFQTFTRQGYDAAATATTYSEQVPMLRRVREPYPNQLTDTASNVALGDYILSTDTATDVTNNSTETSPKPIAMWVMRDRQMVGDTIDWEIIAFHYYARNNRQVAAVRVRANDGTTQTPWQVVASTAISSYCEDANPVEVYRGTLNISALAAGTVAAPTVGWLEAEVMPWIGATASVFRSEDQTEPREFSRRYFGRNVSRAATPPLAYVSSTGVDATGVWSTTAATASGLPFLTVTGALNAFNDAARGTPATNNILDGCRIRIVDTVNLGAGSATSRPQNVASVVVERAPGTSRAAAIVTVGATFRSRIGTTGLSGGLTEGAITFYDMTINRTGAFTFAGETANLLQVAIHNVVFSNSSATQFLSNAAAYMFGVTFPGTNVAIAQSGAASQKRMLRGVTIDVNSANQEAWVTIGSTITRPSLTASLDTTKQRIAYSNKWLNPSSTNGVAAWVGTVAGENIGPIVWAQNLIEATHTTTATAGFRAANDSPAVGNIVHAVIHHNVNTGYNSVNRNNFFYDESPIARFHKFVSQVGDLPSQLNTKGDIFALDGTRLGQFAYTHGVGCRGNFTMFQTNSAVLWSEFQTFPGIGSVIGASSTVRNDPLFTDYEGTGGSGGTPSAGAGGGTYTLTAPSPARGIVAKPVLAFDLAGAVRPSINDAAGAYA